MDIINMTGDDEPYDDEKLQLELALAASMEQPAAPAWRQQRTSTATAGGGGGEVDPDDEVMKRALAESMRTYEQEQTGATPSSQPAAARRKRTSAGGDDDGEAPAPPASLKRQRSSGLPLSPPGSSQWQQQQQHHIMVAPAALQQQVQQQQQQVHPLPPAGDCGSKQQPGGGFGRSGSVQDLQQAGADGEGSDEQQQQQYPDAADHDAPSGDSQPGSAAVGGGDQDWATWDAAHGRQFAEPDDDDDDELAGVVSSSSDSSIAHSSGLPHANTAWARRGLAGRGLLGDGGGGGRLVGPALVPGERSGAWRLYGRQFYPTQPVYWQQGSNAVSYAGRVLSVTAGEDGPGVVTYMVEVYHPFLRYVDVSAQQLHPQLRRGDLVWAKPATMAPNTWSQRGPLFDSLHGPGGPGRIGPSAAPWMLARVVKTDLHNGCNPIAEVRFDASPSDQAYALVSQLELVREIGESSSTAAARSSSGSAGQQQQPQQQQQPAGDGEPADAEMAAATALHDMAAGLQGGDANEAEAEEGEQLEQQPDGDEDAGAADEELGSEEEEEAAD